MPHRFQCIYIHCVFIVKRRQPWLMPDLLGRLGERMNHIAKRHRCIVMASGGVADHMHLLVSLNASVSLSQLVKYLKGSTSRWIQEIQPEMDYFSWQEGYGAFSLGVNQLDRTKRYIENQPIRHRDISLEDEMEWFRRVHESE